MSEFGVDSDRRKGSADKSLAAYKDALDVAVAELPPTHPMRLALALNFSVFCYEILASHGRAVHVAQQAFYDARAGLNDLSETRYKESTLIMQLLWDNIVFWTSDKPIRTDREEGLSETDNMLGVQFLQTDQEKLPRKKDKALNTEVMVVAQSGYIDHQRLPRKKQELDAGVTVELEAKSGYINHQPEKPPRKKLGNEELDGEVMVEAQSRYIDYQRLPRKKQELDAEVTVELEAKSGYINHLPEKLPRKKKLGNEELGGEVMVARDIDGQKLPRKKLGNEALGGWWPQSRVPLTRARSF